MTCAKTEVMCNIWSGRGEVVSGSNRCRNPQRTCPREPGEDYTKCKTICDQVGHAEMDALCKAKEKNMDLRGATAVIRGHYYACEKCAKALKDAGIATILIHNGNPKE